MEIPLLSAVIDTQLYQEPTEEKGKEVIKDKHE